MRTDLSVFGNIPVTAATIASLYPRLSGKNQKVQQLERNGEIIRLKKGLYVVKPPQGTKPLSTELIAGHLYAPSYISKSSALSYYGLIPERVYTTQSMTIKQPRVFNTPLGRFEYSHTAREAFHVGLRSIVKDGFAFVMASPEKALCDLIADATGIWLRYLKEARDYLEADIRLDMEAFWKMDTGIFEAYVEAGGKKRDSIKTLIRFLQHGQPDL